MDLTVSDRKNPAVDISRGGAGTLCRQRAGPDVKQTIRLPQQGLVNVPFWGF